MTPKDLSNHQRDILLALEPYKSLSNRQLCAAVSSQYKLLSALESLRSRGVVYAKGGPVTRCQWGLTQAGVDLRNELMKTLKN